MAIKKATNVGGDFLDLKQLCQDGPVLVLFKITEFQAPEKDDFNKNTYPVRADAVICSGPRLGEVYPDGVFKFAPANVLRGISLAASDQGEAPANAVGDEIAVRVNMINRKGKAAFVGLDEPSGPEFAAIEEAYADGAIWSSKGKQLAGVGAGPANPAASGRPWD